MFQLNSSKEKQSHQTLFGANIQSDSSFKIREKCQSNLAASECCSSVIMNFRSSFSSNKDPFGVYDIGRSNCDTSSIRNPCANAADPSYFSNRFPCAENA